jgi:MFS family permease
MIFAAGMAALPYIRGEGAGMWTLLLGALALLAVGSSLVRPPVFGMISMLTPAGEQGSIIGVAQSAGSLARIVGPIFAGATYQYAHALPYGVCSAIALTAGLIAWVKMCKPGPEPAGRTTDGKPAG